MCIYYQVDESRSNSNSVYLIGIEEEMSSRIKEESDDTLYGVDEPRVAASVMEVELMEPEEKLGPSLGRVLGNRFQFVMVKIILFL